jgi:3-oxoacyl-[acyl-carrier protein] reductase
MELLLEHKNAVIYGGGGSIGGAVSRAFGREGATVFLAGRTRAKLEDVAEDIRAEGGSAETAEVDHAGIGRDPRVRRIGRPDA